MNTNTITEKLSYTQFGAIQLKKLAIPGSASVTVDGRPLPVKSFDLYGAPILPKSVVQVLEQKEIIAKRCNYPIPEVLVTYKEQEIRSSRANTLQDQSYIESKCKTLKELFAYITEVKVFKKAFPSFRGKSWVLFGRYLLTEDGKLFELESHHDKVHHVLNAKEFSDTDLKLKTPFEIILPSAVDVCPHCLKNFTIADVVNGNFDVETFNGVWHKKCVNEVVTTTNMFKETLKQ